ncbi:MAG TPA: Rv3235 family protein [Actinospica sp.]|nr:Rv3235 family protein [Actinospica sp.]
MLEDDIFLITEVNISDSGLQRVAGALADHGGAGGTAPGQRGWLKSWVTGWTHRLDVDPLGLPQPEPIAGVGRLAEAVVDVLLERRPLEQMRRWLSRDVAGQLMPQAPAPSPGKSPAHAQPPPPRAPRFASRSMIRSVRLHQPAAGIVESTVVVQDGPRVRAVALRFEQSAPATPGRHGAAKPGGFDWLCTALQFN